MADDSANHTGPIKSFCGMRNANMTQLSLFHATNLFVAWLGYQLMAFPIFFLAKRKLIPYRVLWIGLFLFLQIRGLIPLTSLIQHIIPQAHIAFDISQFVGAWGGMIFGVVFCTSYGSVLAYIERKREDAEQIAQIHHEADRNFGMMTVINSHLVETTSKRVQKLLNPSHDPA